MKFLDTKLFAIISNLPLIGGLMTLLFIISIINNKQLLPESTRKGIAMQFFAPLVYFIGRLVSFLLWFFFGLMILEKIISWISLIWLLGCYIYMLKNVLTIIKDKKADYGLFDVPLKVIEKFLWH